jgi:hypothetical protein
MTKYFCLCGKFFKNKKESEKHIHLFKNDHYAKNVILL